MAKPLSIDLHELVVAAVLKEGMSARPVATRFWYRRAARSSGPASPRDRIDVFDQSINSASFTAWVEQRLVPTLGYVVAMDNLCSHKRPAVRASICARGARL